MIYYTEQRSPIGMLLLAATTQGLCGLYFDEHRHFKGKDGWLPDAGLTCLQQAALQLDEYFARQRMAFDVPLDLTGTPFQRSVWQQLMRIPFGATASYSQQAHGVGKPKAVRAVGSAIGRNPVSIIVPCHRIVGASGALTGYAGGIERKRYLLALEGAQ